MRNSARFLKNSMEDSKILAAGFYSWNESEDLEEDLNHTQEHTNENKFYFQHSYDLQQNSQYPLNLLKANKEYMHFSNDDIEYEEVQSRSMM
jgi:imidazoleglycerol phosphate synthase glutamine amidotransferase subunit HisH